MFFLLVFNFFREVSVGTRGRFLWLGYSFFRGICSFFIESLRKIMVVKYRGDCSGLGYCGAGIFLRVFRVLRIGIFVRC